jgi:5-methylcytosine-specific restriction endonuclease McrA
MKPKPRDYVRERLNESPQRRKARAERHKARAMIEHKLASKYGEAKAKAMLKGKDVDHKTPIALGGKTEMSNLRIRNAHSNRSDKSTIFKGKKTTRPKHPRTQ